MAPANSFAGGAVATAQLGDVANRPVDGAGAAINTQQTAAQAAASMNCSLAVPANPLTAAGLATPWQLGDGCSMANAGTEGAFVEATILSPGGQLSVYSPLVVTAGTQLPWQPTAPAIAAGSRGGDQRRLQRHQPVPHGAGANQGKCVDALGQSVIGQVSACNAVNFYKTANADIAQGTLKVPAAGTATDGQACQTTRDFALIDQDQSDNVVSQYLITAGGQTAQNSPANSAQLTGATVLTNGSDDALLSEFVDPANGCTPFTAPDTTYPKPDGPSQALNELQARVDQAGTIAVVPPNDEMTLVGGNMSIAKTNVFRSITDQPLLAGNTNPATVAASYCQNMVNIAPARNNLDMAKDAGFGTRWRRSATTWPRSSATGCRCPSSTWGARTTAWPTRSTSPWTGTASPPRCPITCPADGEGCGARDHHDVNDHAGRPNAEPCRWPGDWHAGPGRPREPVRQPVRHVTSLDSHNR